jgi:hypothetical protein
MGESRLSMRRNGTSETPLCGASGWRLRISCADSNRNATCPLCGQQVRTRPDIIGGHPVRVIKEHGRLRDLRPMTGT